MNKYLLGFGLIFILVSSVSIIGNFFDIQYIYYFPFVMWGIALCIFYMVLPSQHINIFYPPETLNVN